MISLAGANLSFTNLRDTNLSGADFKDAVLYNTNLRDADLENATSLIPPSSLLEPGLGIRLPKRSFGSSVRLNCQRGCL